THEPRDDRVPDDERDDRGEERRPPRHVPLARVLQLEDPRGEHGGDREQERVPRRRGARVAHEQTAADRGARAGDAGNEGERLATAVDEPVPYPEVVERLALSARAVPAAVLVARREEVREAEDEPHDDERRRDELQVAERALDLVLERDAE